MTADLNWLEVEVMRHLTNPHLLPDQIESFIIRLGGIVGAIAAVFQILQMVNQPISILQFRIGGPLFTGLTLTISVLLAVAWELRRRKPMTDTMQDALSHTGSELMANSEPYINASADSGSVAPNRQIVYLRDVVFRPPYTSVEKFRWTEAGLVSLIFLFSLYILYLSFSEYRKEQALLGAFEVTPGTVLLKKGGLTRDGFLSDSHITYSYQATATSSTDVISYTKSVSVPEIVFNSVSELDTIPIRFASEKPEWSEIDGQHVSSTPTALVYLGIAIASFGYATKRARQLMLEFIFHQGTHDSRTSVNGEVMTGWINNNAYHVAFRFTSDDEEYRVGQAVAHTDFFALRIGDQLEISYLVQRPSICKAVRYRTGEGTWSRFQKS